MTRFEITDSDSDCSSNSSSSSDWEERYENEPPHPLGFASDPLSPWGKTWFSLDPPPCSVYASNRSGRSTYALEEEEDDLLIQSYPPLSKYLSKEQVTTKELLRFDLATPFSPRQQSLPRIQHYRDTDDDLNYSDEDDDEGFYHGYDGDERSFHGDSYDTDENNNEESEVDLMIAKGREINSSTPKKKLLTASTPVASSDEVWEKRDETERRIQRRIQAERLRIDEECRRTTEILSEIVLRSNQEAETIIRNRRAEEDRLQKAQDARKEQERKRREEAEKQDALRKEQAAKEAQKEQRIQEKARQDKEAREAAAEQKKRESEAKAKEKTAHIEKAYKLVGQLVQLRASVEPFEKNKAVGKRRLGMKKIARGKVNTLNDNPQKIQEVATEISQAITRYDQEDAQIKQQLSQKVPGMTSDMGRGRRYFVDLLACTAMTRVQAESFSGTKGDGFPLASMLAMLATQHKNIIAILQAHVYTVCPTAIPDLYKPKPDATEEQLMSGLGMQKNPKTGEFESYPQFLARTENIVAFMASIQSSLPKTHQLFEGNQGAVLWLERFLGLLPPNTSPLPLITAPVLGAFLTCAGHMLANVHAERFRTMLDKIQNDIVHRLDEGEIGKPSAIRLNKVIEGGFDGFQNNLPAKAIPTLYCGASENSKKNEAVTSFAGTIGGEEDIQPKRDMGAPPQQQSSNPFGGGGGSNSGFGGSNNNNNSQPPANPFGSPSGDSNANPFGGGNNNNTQQPFGSTQPAPAPNPFGSSNSSGTAFGNPSTSSPFGGTPAPAPMTQQPSSPFGGAPAPSPSPFGAAAPSPSPFGSGAAPSPSPFGGGAPTPAPFGSAAPSPSPFGSAAPSPSPFGGAPPTPAPFGSTAPTPSPFGAAAPSPSPFGGAAPSPSPFGGAAPSPSSFGGSAPSPSPFGGAAPSPSPFGGAAPSPSPFGTSTNASPFGGGAAPSPSPFGGASAPSPSPFGAPNNAANSSPFGGGTSMQQNSPFGGGSQQNAPFGGGNSMQQNSPFGGGSQQNSPFGGGNKTKGFGNQGLGRNSQRNNRGFGSNSNHNSTFASSSNNNNGFGSNSNHNSGFGSNSNHRGKKMAPICKYFAKGHCRFGKNCRFSHDLGATGGSGGGGFGGGNSNHGFQSNNWNSFGGPRR